MNFFRRLLLNHVLANLTFVLVLVVGSLSYLSLPRQQDPTINFNWIIITTVLPGASASDVEKKVTDPLEDGLRRLQDVDFISSNSRESISNILVRFEDIDDRVFDKRVAFHDGADEIAPGISLHLIGGHTMGVQCVRVLTKRGWVVLASDASHFYENFQKRKMFPIVLDARAMLEGFERLEALADSPDHIIPGHDPLVCSLYPAEDGRVADIVRRLDVAPKGS